MIKSKIVFCILLLSFSCESNTFNDNIETIHLKSSKGENVYILSTIWGVTGDYQLTTITSDKNKFNNGRDTVGSVYGLNPFEYKFRNDTLTLYFKNKTTYHVDERFKTVTMQYKIMDKEYYKTRDTSFHTVPDIKPQRDPSSPKPPRSS
jgi:hypothetical protein